MRGSRIEWASELREREPGQTGGVFKLRGSALALDTSIIGEERGGWREQGR